VEILALAVFEAVSEELTVEGTKVVVLELTVIAGVDHIMVYMEEEVIVEETEVVAEEFIMGEEDIFWYLWKRR
jgi:hypothetical protein